MKTSKNNPVQMNPYFYSLGMLVTRRMNDPVSPMSAMDLLAAAIADEEHGHHPLIDFLFRPKD